MKTPQIDNGKTAREHLNIRHCPVLPAYTPYGNLANKGMMIIARLDAVNLEIERVFNSYSALMHANALGNFLAGPSPNEHLFYAEQVIYWLRKTADEVIALASVLEGHERTGSWPVEIEPDSIGKLLNGRKLPERISRLIEPHRDFLRMLNDVSNAFKHSFINTDVGLVGAEYPVLYALQLKQNDTSREPVLHSVTFSTIIEGFSTFYQNSMQTLQAWAPEHLSNPEAAPGPITAISVWPQAPVVVAQNSATRESLNNPSNR
jgi:hypothetical protein